MKIFLKGSKTSLITLVKDISDPSTRLPAVGIFAPISNADGPRAPKRAEGMVTGFIITDIQPASNKDFDGRVKVFFNAGRNDAPREETEYSVIVPIQYLAASMALSAVSEPLGGMPLTVFDSAMYKPNDKFPMGYDAVSFMLVFPMKETVESELISEKLEAFINEKYATALTPISWDKVSIQGADTPNPNLSTAQGIMFNNLIALARGDIGALMQIISMEEHIEAVLGDDNDDEEWFEEDEISEDEGEFSEEMLSDEIAQQLEDIENAPLPEDDYHVVEDEQDLREEMQKLDMVKKAIYPLCFNIADTMLERVRNFDPGIKATVTPGHETIAVEEYEPETDIRFSELTSGLEEVFKGVGFDDKSPADEKRAKDIAFWGASIEETCPTMAPLFEYIDSLPGKYEYRDILATDLTGEQAHKLVPEYGIGKVFTAMCIAVAAYALKKGQMIVNYDEEHTIPAPEIISNLIRVNDTDFAWEIPALTGSLVRYEIGNAIDVLCMNYKPSNMMENAAYLLNTINYIAEVLIHNPFWEEISPEDLKAKLDSFSDNTPEFKNFKVWFVNFYTLLKAAHTDHDSKENAKEAYSAISEFLSSERDIKVMASHAVRTLLAMADIIAFSQGVDEDHPEWTVRRASILNALLTKVAEEAGSRLNFAIR